MLQQSSGILPVWVESGESHPFFFVESVKAGDWVLNVAPDEKAAASGVCAGHVRFCRHRMNDRIRAQCFYMFDSAEPFLWRVWFDDVDGRCSEFEWFARFGGKWWWVPFRKYCGDDNSPHSVRFQVMVDTGAYGGLPWRARKVFLIVRNNHGKLLYREVFANPDFA